MTEKYYTAERNVQIVIALLKAHGIRKVVASPGTTNMTFVGSIQQDDYFQIYSSVDERSAAYIACGMAEASGEPVVLSCTGATASRNYMSGLTEAYYRKLPVLAITSHRGDHAIGHLLDQQIDRRAIPADIAMESVVVPLVKDKNDEQYCIIEANKAMLALTRHGGGPAHINMHTSYNPDFSVKELPAARAIRRISINNEYPKISKEKKIAIFVGAHKPFTGSEKKAIDSFCATNNAVVFCDHTSGYNGKYRVNYALVCCQRYHTSPQTKIDILIHIGEVSGNSYGLILHPKEVWRVSPDGELRDTFRKLTYVFEMKEERFFNIYNQNEPLDDSYLQQCKKEYTLTLKAMPELPFGNAWIAQQIHDKLPMNSTIHFGILNSLRSWNFFELDPSIKSNCNVGGFGIDGGVSSLVGATLAEPDRLHFGVFGDLAFFYDMNVVGNRHVGNNIRILLINNGKGAEFRLFSHPCSPFGEAADSYMAAAGHYGNKSPQLVKHYAEDLGYKYITASSKDEFINACKIWLDTDNIEQPILFEVFTESQNESNSLEMITTYIVDDSVKTKLKIKNALDRFGGEKVVNLVRKVTKQ